MKKIFGLAFCVSMLFLAMSCGSAPAPQPAPAKEEPKQEPVVQEEPVKQEVVEQVYDTYTDSLDLNGAKTYKVVYGDTLTKIAKKFYGSEKGYYFPMIMLGSSATAATDPDNIEPGDVFTIPELDKNINNPKMKPQLKAYFRGVSEYYKRKSAPHAEETSKALLEISEQL